MVRWGGDRDLFSVLFLPPDSIPITTGRMYQRGALPAAWSPSRGRPAENPPLLRSALGGLEIQTEVSADPDGGKGAPALHMDLQQLQEATASYWWFFPTLQNS